MTSLKQNIRTVLVEVETFLVETLKSVKLSKSSADQKDRLLEKIKRLLEEIPGSTASGQFDSSSTSNGSLKISAGGENSNNSSASLPQDDDSQGYSDDISKIAVANLKNKLQSGYLDKKKKSGLRSWEARYCVVSGNILYLYKKETDTKQKEAVCLTDYEFRDAPSLEKDASKKELCFEIVKPGSTTLQFRASSREGLIEWRDAITKGTQLISTLDADGKCYEDVSEKDGSTSISTFPAESAQANEFDETDDIYEDAGEETLPLPTKPPPQPIAKHQVVPHTKVALPEIPKAQESDDIYDDCTSAQDAVAREDHQASSTQPAGSKLSKTVPPIPVQDLPSLPSKVSLKTDGPALPGTLPPPIPDRRPSDSTLPPLPNNPPPLPNRAAITVKTPHLNKGFVLREEDFENIYIGKWDCSADTDKELSFKRGDLIHVISRDLEADRWWVGELGEKIGLVPKEYLCPAYELVA